MGRDTYSSRGEWAIAIAMVVGVVLALLLLLGIQEARASSGGWRLCGNVAVQFGHGSEGGGADVLAKGITCRPAREVTRSCIRDHEAAGWTAVNWDLRTELHRGAMTVSFIQIGGGGCGRYPHRCRGFDYRDVSFNRIWAVGVRCEGRTGAGAMAKAWYDVGGSCWVDSSCQLGDFRCVGVESTGEVTCTKQNGYRVRWEITGNP